MARFLAESLGDRPGDLELVVSELVNNAFLHGRGEIRLALRLDGDRVSGHVVDAGDGFSPTRSARRVDEPGGFGLGIVGRLSSLWGVRDGASHVWFEMDLVAESRRPSPPPIGSPSDRDPRATRVAPGRDADSAEPEPSAVIRAQLRQGRARGPGRPANG